MPAATPIGRPPPDSDERLETPDGEWLHLEIFVPPGAPRAVVVFLHGFSSYAAPYRHVAQSLADAGFAVTLFDARGHGHSTGRRGYVDRFSDYVSDLRAVTARARTLFPHIPLALIGHSQGGAVILDYLLGDGSGPDFPMPDCAVVATPMLEIIVPVPWFKRLADAIFGPLFPRFSTGNGLRGDMISRNPEVRQAFERDPLVHHVATPRWFSEAKAAQERIRSSVKKLVVPTLLITAGRDRIVSAPAQNAFAGAASPGLLQQKTYDDLFHEVFFEPERDRVTAEMIAWLKAKLPGGV